jgi:hypothetical protein
METKKYHREQKEENNLEQKIVEQIFCNRRNKSIRTKEQITYCMETKNITGNKNNKTTWKKNCGTNFL